MPVPDRSSLLVDCAYVFSFCVVLSTLKMNALYIVSKIGTMKHIKLRQLVHFKMHTALRQFWLKKRGLSQSLSGKDTSASLSY